MEHCISARGGQRSGGDLTAPDPRKATAFRRGGTAGVTTALLIFIVLTFISCILHSFLQNHNPQRSSRGLNSAALETETQVGDDQYLLPRGWEFAQNPRITRPDKP